MGADGTAGTDSGGYDSTVSGADGADGADVTGGEPSLVEGRCLFLDADAEANNLFGYRYQCSGRLEATIEFNFGSESIIVDYGPSTEGDTYAEPKVMACCPPVGVDAPCEEPHIQACVVDALVQGCKSLATRLEEYGADLGAAGKEAANKAADFIAKNQTACYNAFAVNTGIAGTTPACDAANNNVPHFPDEAIGGSWSFDPPGLIDDVTITVTNAEFFEVFPWTTDPEYPGDECRSSEDNDHVVLSEVPLGLGPDDFTTLFHGRVEVRGSNFIESATLASTRTACSEGCSRLAIVGPAGAKRLSYLLARGDALTTVGGIDVDAFRAELVGEAHALNFPGSLVYEIPRDSATFAISGRALGSSALVGVTNYSPIRFRPGHLAGSWDMDPIQLRYTDAQGDVYDFFLGASRWQ